MKYTTLLIVEILHFVPYMPSDLNHLKTKIDQGQIIIGVVGLGYVGLPLALFLARHYTVIGFDLDTARVEELQKGIDRNNESAEEAFKGSSCNFSARAEDLGVCDIYIVTVPTPLKDDNQPDLSMLEEASQLIAPHLNKGNIAVFESTVYPGVTEDVCGPLLKEGSKLTCGKDFYLGYSPERINPGDKEHTVDSITKVVAGQTEEVADILAQIYGQINGGNVFKAKDIKTAEASKVIENAQRDINVAFINEVTQVTNKLGLSIHDVLEAAGTKWNFLPFTPGLVGGHCIGVDPYYLARCAEKMGHDPEVILSGRRINDGMGTYFAQRLLANLPDKAPKKILLLGFTFKENINDIRGTKVIDIYQTLKTARHDVTIHDPHADLADVKSEYGVDMLTDLPVSEDHDAIVLCVAHDVYKKLTESNIQTLLLEGGLVYDLKGIWRDHSFGEKSAYLGV